MSTYYEILKLQPTATTVEIEAAIDTQYNQWRRLVTHHDPNVVDEANRALRTLERIRAMLTNPDKRAGYDAAIGIGGQIGGLADPEALLQAMPPPSPPGSRASQLTSSPSTPKSMDAWVCPKCRAPNRVGVRHCAKCGQQIGRECPKCHELIAVADGFCPHCGVDVEALLHQQQAEEAARLTQEREAARRQAEEAARAEAENKARARRNRIGCGIGCLLILGLLISIGVLFSQQAAGTVSQARATLAASQAQSSAATATAEALIPKWIGTSIEVRATLRDVNDSRFEIGYAIINRTQSDYVASFLTSDIAVSDDQGNIYYPSRSTEPVRDTIPAHQSREYTLYYEGTLDPGASALTLSTAQISDEHDITLVIPLIPLTDQIDIGFELNQVWDDGLEIRATMQNHAASDFVARFRASDVVVTDDWGNQYQMSEYDREEQYAALLSPSDYHGSFASYQWRFSPGIAPGASTLQVMITDFMGQQFEEVIPLGTPANGVRYEATISYVGDDWFRVSFRVFNIGADDLIVRFDEGSVLVLDASGQPLPSRETDRRHVDVVGSGSHVSYDLSFQGVPPSTNGLTLFLQIFSGTQDVQVLIQTQP